MIPWDDVLVIFLAVVIGVVISKKLVKPTSSSTSFTATRVESTSADPLEAYMAQNHPNAI